MIFIITIYQYPDNTYLLWNPYHAEFLRLQFNINLSGCSISQTPGFVDKAKPISSLLLDSYIDKNADKNTDVDPTKIDQEDEIYKAGYYDIALNLGMPPYLLPNYQLSYLLLFSPCNINIVSLPRGDIIHTSESFKRHFLQCHKTDFISSIDKNACLSGICNSTYISPNASTSYPYNFIKPFSLLTNDLLSRNLLLTDGYHYDVHLNIYDPSTPLLAYDQFPDGQEGFISNLSNINTQLPLLKNTINNLEELLNQKQNMDNTDCDATDDIQQSITHLSSVINNKKRQQTTLLEQLSIIQQDGAKKYPLLCYIPNSHDIYDNIIHLNNNCLDILTNEWKELMIQRVMVYNYHKNIFFSAQNILPLLSHQKGLYKDICDHFHNYLAKQYVITKSRLLEEELLKKNANEKKKQQQQQQQQQQSKQNEKNKVKNNTQVQKNNSDTDGDNDGDDDGEHCDAYLHRHSRWLLNLFEWGAIPLPFKVNKNRTLSNRQFCTFSMKLSQLASNQSRLQSQNNHHMFDINNSNMNNLLCSSSPISNQSYLNALSNNHLHGSPIQSYHLNELVGVIRHVDKLHKSFVIASQTPDIYLSAQIAHFDSIQSQNDQNKSYIEQQQNTSCSHPISHFSSEYYTQLQQNMSKYINKRKENLQTICTEQNNQTMSDHSPLPQIDIFQPHFSYFVVKSDTSMTTSGIVKKPTAEEVAIFLQKNTE